MLEWSAMGRAGAPGARREKEPQSSIMAGAAVYCPTLTGRGSGDEPLFVTNCSYESLIKIFYIAAGASVSA